MINYKLIFYIINIAIILSLFFFCTWLFNRYRFTKGDPCMSPHYKKTSYSSANIQTCFNFKTFFSTIDKNIQNKPISYYKWILYYDEKLHMFWEAKLVCFYKIGLQKTIFHFEWDKLRYIDKTGIMHLSFDLIYKRNMENFLAANLKRSKNLLPAQNSDFEEVYTKEGNLIGFNIKTGNIRYEIVKYSGKKL